MSSIFHPGFEVGRVEYRLSGERLPLCLRDEITAACHKWLILGFLFVLTKVIARGNGTQILESQAPRHAQIDFHLPAKRTFPTKALIYRHRLGLSSPMRSEYTC